LHFLTFLLIKTERSKGRQQRMQILFQRLPQGRYLHLLKWWSHQPNGLSLNPCSDVSFTMRLQVSFSTNVNSYNKFNWRDSYVILILSIDNRLAFALCMIDFGLHADDIIGFWMELCVTFSYASCTYIIFVGLLKLIRTKNRVWDHQWRTPCLSGMFAKPPMKSAGLNDKIYFFLCYISLFLFQLPTVIVIVFFFCACLFVIFPSELRI